MKPFCFGLSIVLLLTFTACTFHDAVLSPQPTVQPETPSTVDWEPGEPENTAREFLAKYFDAADSGDVTRQSSGWLTEDTKDIDLLWQYLEWKRLLRKLEGYSIESELGYFCDLVTTNIHYGDDGCVELEGYIITTVNETSVQMTMRRNENQSLKPLSILSVCFPDDEVFVRFVERFKEITGKHDYNKSMFIDSERNRLMREAMEGKTLEQGIAFFIGVGMDRYEIANFLFLEYDLVGMNARFMDYRQGMITLDEVIFYQDDKDAASSEHVYVNKEIDEVSFALNRLSDVSYPIIGDNLIPMSSEDLNEYIDDTTRYDAAGFEDIWTCYIDDGALVFAIVEDIERKFHVGP